MGTLGGALLGKMAGKALSNAVTGQPVFRNVLPFGIGSRGNRMSNPGYPSGPMTGGGGSPLPTTNFSPGQAFGGSPFGSAPMGQGTFAPGNNGQMVTFGTGGGGKSGLGSILSGAAKGVGGAIGGIGNLLGGIGGSRSPSSPSSQQPSAGKSGLVAPNNGNMGDDVGSDWNAGAEGYTPIHIDGQAGPDLYAGTSFASGMHEK